MKARPASRLAVAAAALLCALAAGCGAGSGERPKPIRVGVLGICVAPFYAQQLAGAELPLLERGGRLRGPSPSDGVVGASLAGRPIELDFGCTGGSAGSSQSESTLAEARRLVENDHVDVLVVGDSDVVTSDYARLRPDVTFVDILAPPAAVTLTDPPANSFSFSLNAEQWMAGLGTYAYRTLGWRRAVTVETSEPGAWEQAAGFMAEFCALGGTIVKRVAAPFLLGAPVDLSQYGPMLAQIPPHGVDGFLIGSDLGSPSLLALAERYPGLRGSLARKIVGFTGNFDATVLGPIARRLEGVVTSDPGGIVSTGPAWDRYNAELHQAFPNVPIVALGISFGASTGIEAVLRALASVHGDLSHGERRFMAALAKVRVAVAGQPIRLDARRAAIGTIYLRKLEVDPHRNLVDGGIYKRIDNVEETFGGYFTSATPPPGASTPSCHRGNPTPWAGVG
jgi:branched-chain amino acid transport system substrate-binding protein